MRLVADKAGGLVQKPCNQRDTLVSKGPPKPRYSRRNKKITRWPPEHLALLMAMWEEKMRPSSFLPFLRNHFTHILVEYEERNGYAVTASALAQRPDKGLMLRELRNYVHLMPEARRKIKNVWGLQ